MYGKSVEVKDVKQLVVVIYGKICCKMPTTSIDNLRQTYIFPNILFNIRIEFAAINLLSYNFEHA